MSHVIKQRASIIALYRIEKFIFMIDKEFIFTIDEEYVFTIDKELSGKKFGKKI